jgi:hypothetical protein
MLAPFGVRSFRFQWPADLLTSWAFEMETIILSWYVLVETRSVRLAHGVRRAAVSRHLDRARVRQSQATGSATALAVWHASHYTVFARTLLKPAPCRCGHAAGRSGHRELERHGAPSDLGVRSALIAETMPAEALIGGLSMSRTTHGLGAVAGALAGAGCSRCSAWAGLRDHRGFYRGGALLMLGGHAPMRRITWR